MKRYRGKDANYQRFGSAFVPAHKWGKRNKREFLKQIDDPRQHEPLLREIFGWLYTEPWEDFAKVRGF